MTGADQKDALRRLGLRVVANRAATLAYGPTGVELWTGPGNGRRVFAFGWDEIDDVDEGPVANPRGVTFAGLRMVPVDAAPQSIPGRRPHAPSGRQHPARTWAGSVALDMREVRAGRRNGNRPAPEGPACRPWRVRDSNPRRRCQLIYSQPPLATRVTRQGVPTVARPPPGRPREQRAGGRIATPGQC